ncbi:MAG: hypothetical protein A2Y10_12785 [Planctomycetes bacterium GWF2_41_51]|nr:MAG: hypothetical protein A2Y10_12785 [Planctomycetes bacterium GWF2_41_51]HBG27301.1 hypothetical protein [Phycisphaerales bacterium]
MCVTICFASSYIIFSISLCLIDNKGTRSYTPFIMKMNFAAFWPWRASGIPVDDYSGSFFIY